MNLMQMMLDTRDAPAVSQIGQKVGLDAASTKSLIGQLAPALSHELKRNASGSKGLEGLARALSSNKHERYLDQPAEL